MDNKHLLGAILSHLDSFLGQRVAYGDEQGHRIINSQFGGLGGHHPGGGGTTPPPTLVGASGGTQIDLIWDSSVSNAPSGFMAAVTNTASYMASLSSSPEVINVHVGWGEVAGQTLSSADLGASETNGYLTNYATVTSHLEAQGYTFNAANEPANAQFFLSDGEAKAFNVANPYDTAVDGYIGFGTLNRTGDSWNMTTSSTGAGTGTGTNQFDLQSVVQHELSEVTGRIGMEGGTTFNGLPTYTPLDLFNYSSPGVLELSGGGGYFSTDNGSTNLGTFNDASLHGGDIADWASFSSPFQAGTTGLASGDQDAYNAFGYPGINGDLSQSDVRLAGALGYTLSPFGNSIA
jgi:hypothetical protein